MPSRPNSFVSAPGIEPDVAEPTVDQRTRGLAFRHIEPLAFIGDSIVIFIASIVCGAGYHLLISDQVGSIEDFVGIGVLFWVNFTALTSAQRNYRVDNLINRGRQLRYVTMNWWLICLVLAGVAFTLKISDHFSRGATLLFFIVGWGCLLAYRFTLAHRLSLALARGAFAQRKIIVFAEREQLNSSRALVDLKRCGYSPVKTVEFTAAEIEAARMGKSVQVKVNDAIKACQSEAIDHIVVLIKWDRRQFIEDLTRLLRVVAIPVNLLADHNATRFLNARNVSVGTAWTVELQRAPLSNTEQNFKRAFDLCLATAAIVILSPILLTAALMIKFDSTGPIFFKQKRHGFNGRTFVIYKFRTMHVLEDGAVIRQARRNDSRVTRLGRWLRQTSIDELPQLINVLVGQMSLVGPRPHAVAHNDEYQKVVANYALRHHMKPGITGWAQVNGHRGETETVNKMERRVEHDLWYINHWSPWLDLRILFKTVLLASRQPTAY